MHNNANDQRLPQDITSHISVCLNFLHVYTFLQEIHTTLNPLYVIKADDDVYVRQALCMLLSVLTS